MRKSPEATPLQFTVLSIVGERPVAGREIRQLLTKDFDRPMTLAGFYDLMSRMEAAELVKGEYEQRVVGDQRVTERSYRITDKGSAAWSQTRDFFANTATAPGHLLPQS